jgi:hypothetical protein
MAGTQETMKNSRSSEIRHFIGDNVDSTVPSYTDLCECVLGRKTPRNVNFPPTLSASSHKKTKRQKRKGSRKDVPWKPSYPNRYQRQTISSTANQQTANQQTAMNQLALSLFREDERCTNSQPCWCPLNIKKKDAFQEMVGCGLCLSTITVCVSVVR